MHTYFGAWKTEAIFNCKKWCNIIDVSFMQFIVKFIKKKKVLKENWVDNAGGKMPLEVALLSQLEHPNIVKVSWLQNAV